jgi:hypothetical protein
MIEALLRAWPEVLLWGLLATAAMSTVLSASQGLGWSRLGLPYLLGTWVTGRRRAANLTGFVAYLLGGWAFAVLYFCIFASLGRASWWLGGVLGLVHGAFVLAVFLPLLAHIHPRVASEYDGPDARHRIEPPGFLGLNYGAATPLITLAAQLGYGLVLGFGYSHVL